MYRVMKDTHLLTKFVDPKYPNSPLAGLIFISIPLIFLLAWCYAFIKPVFKKFPNYNGLFIFSFSYVFTVLLQDWIELATRDPYMRFSFHVYSLSVLFCIGISLIWVWAVFLKASLKQCIQLGCLIIAPYVLRLIVFPI